MLELIERIKRELVELKQARASAVVVLGLGLVAGWMLAAAFYTERLSLMEQQVSALQSQATAAAVDAASGIPRRLIVWLASVGGVIAVLLVWLFWKRKGDVPATLCPDWLLATAETDISNADTFLYTPRQTIYNRPHLDAPEPYVDLWFGFINATVYDMTLDAVEGRVNYLTEPLSSRPEPLENNPKALRHGDYGQFAVRQWLPTPVAQQIIQRRAANKQPHFQPGTLRLVFGFTDHSGKRQRVEKAFSEAFVID